MKRYLGYLLSCTMIMVSLLGCSQSQPDTPAGSGEQQKTASEPSASESSQSPVTLEFFVQQSMYYDAFLEAVDIFNKENPDIILEPNNAPEPEKVLQTRVMNNTVPDIISTWSSAADFKQYAADGFFLDLTGQGFLEAVDKNFLNTLKIDSKDYSIPIYYASVGLYYNKRILADNGLSVPATYQELIDICEALKAKGITAFTFHDKEDWSHGKLNTPIYVNYIPNSQQFFEDLQAGKTSAASSDGYREFADILLELRKYAPPDTLSIDYGTALNQFAGGEVAMVINGSWYSAQVRDANPDCDFEMIPFPAASAGDSIVPITVDASLAISANIGDNKDSALRVLEFFSRADIAQMISDKSANPCLIQGVSFNDPSLKQVIDKYADGKVAPWPQDLWPGSVVGENYKVVQNYIATKNQEAFFAETDKEFQNAN